MTTATATRSTTIPQEKAQQAVEILRELDIDCWLTFVRETTESGDPILPLILGQPVTWQSAFIFTKDGQRIAIVGRYEDEAVASTGVYERIVPYVQGVSQPLTETLSELDPKQIAINFSTGDVKADGLTHGLYQLLCDYLDPTPYRNLLASAEQVIRALRGRKTPAEVERIRQAIATTDEIFAKVAAHAKPGMSERDISRFMHGELEARHLDPAWDEAMCPIVTTGPDSMVGHGLPSDDLEITPGRVFHLDFGVCENDYCSDLQRAWYVPQAGEPSPPGDVQQAFDTVRRAIEAAYEALRPGVECWTVDAAARSVVTDAGYEEYQHATGHQVGRAAHDGGGVLGPKWERYGRTPFYTVEPGNVFTLELGIDIPGRGYLGLEEMALVTESGAEWLSTPQTEVWTLSG